MAKKKPQETNPQHDLLATTQAALNALSLGYDFEHRAIYLFGPIDKMAAYRFIAGFKTMDRTKGPIHILVSSEGGDTDAGRAIYETIRTAENPTIVEGLGVVASAAVPILQAGTARFLNPHTTVMIHNVSFEIDGGIGTPVVKFLAKEADELNQWYYNVMAERTGRSVKDIERWCEEETAFPAEEAVKHGFADRVLAPRPLPKNFNSAMEELEGSLANLNVMDVVYETPKKKPKKKGKK